MPQGRKKQRGSRAGRQRMTALLSLAALATGVAVVAIVLTTRGADEAPPTTSAAEWSATPFSGGPRLAVNEPVVDAGAVGYGEPVVAAYQLRNVGDEPVVLGQPKVLTLEGC